MVVLSHGDEEGADCTKIGDGYVTTTGSISIVVAIVVVVAILHFDGEIRSTEEVVTSPSPNSSRWRRRRASTTTIPSDTHGH